jgi:hypothetical protein
VIVRSPSITAGLSGWRAACAATMSMAPTRIP